MVEIRKASSHLIAGSVTVVVLTVVPTVIQSVFATIDFVLEGEPPGLKNLVRAALWTFITASVYTTAVVFPAVWVSSRVVTGRGWPGWYAPGVALLISGVVDVALLSRGYWVPDTTLPNWPVWLAAWAFGPGFYIYWLTLRSSQREAKLADV